MISNNYRINTLNALIKLYEKQDCDTYIQRVNTFVFSVIPKEKIRVEDSR